jgi:outer membrane biosynthesis protein TonB
MLSLKWLACISVTAGLAAVAFAGFAANTTPAIFVLAKNTVINLPSQPGTLKEMNPQLIAQKQPKVALVIGNANYEEDRLSNPVNDATDIAKALKELGFEVTLLQNQDLRSMEAAIDDFSRQLRKGGVGVFYYAGHGVQVEGENYLIPLKAKLLNEKDARYEAVALGKVINTMEAAENQVNIIIIDACRDNPFYRRWRLNRRSSNVRGLTAVSPPSGIIIAYATREGNTAADGQGQRNSPFTSALLENIKKPNIDVQLMFRRVSTAVKQKTNAAQQPWTEGNLEGGEFYLNPQSVTVSPIPNPSPSIAVVPTPKPTPSPPPVTSPPVPKPSPSIAVVPTPKPTSSPVLKPGTTLISMSTGVNYTNLRDLLAAGKWKEADEETTKAMLQAAKREKAGWFRQEDIDNFSCEDLRMIDQLWVSASKGKFGFSVQKEIYESLGGTREYNGEVWNKFGDRVGWRKGGSWLWYDELTYSDQAPKGHLPGRIRFFLFAFIGGYEPIYSSFRAKACNL